MYEILCLACITSMDLLLTNPRVPANILALSAPNLDQGPDTGVSFDVSTKCP